MTARDLLRIPDYRRLFLAQAISDIGDGLTFLSLLLLVNELTGSAAALAVMSIAVALPPMTIGLVAGAVADRRDRRTIMLVADATRALVVLGFVAAAAAGSVPLLVVLAAVQASVGTFFSPARSALIPRVVPGSGLLAANSMAQVSRVVGSVVGTGLAGLIVGLAGVVWPAFVIDALTFLASVALVLRTSRTLGRIDPAAAVHAEGIGGAVVAGLRAIAGSRALLGVVLAISVTMLGLGAVNVLFVPFLVNELGASPVWAGPLEGAQTLSMILSGGIVAVVSRRFRVATVATACLVFVAADIVALASVPSVEWLLPVLFAIGWFVTPLQASVATLMMRRTTDELRGRVMAALNAATSTTTIVSTAAAGVFADAIGIRQVFLAGAVVVFAAAILSGILLRGADVPEPAAGPAHGTPSPDAAAAPLAVSAEG